MNDHGKVELHGEVELGTQDRKLLIQILVTEQIKTELADGHDPAVIQRSNAQHFRCVITPVLGVKGMNTHGITHFGEAIRQGADGGNLTGFDTGVQQRLHPSDPPSLSNRLKILLEGLKNDVTVTVD